MIASRKDLLVLRALAGAFLLMAATSIIWPSRFSFCLFYNATGLPCPGCGFTRAVAALLALEVRSALRWHVLALPGVLGLAALFLPANWILKRAALINGAILPGALLLMLYGSLRIVIILAYPETYALFGNAFDQSRWPLFVFSLLKG